MGLDEIEVNPELSKKENKGYLKDSIKEIEDEFKEELKETDDEIDEQIDEAYEEYKDSDRKSGLRTRIDKLNANHARREFFKDIKKAVKNAIK